MRRCGTATLFGVFVCLLLVPAAVRAQSTIAGVVKDTSGAVLPGVTVEASSDVLIERSRTVSTDGAGQYRIVDLRPGMYVVTFTLQGFQTLRRERVDLPADFTASINAELKVGALEESVTVSAESPIVDVTTAVHTQVLNREVIDAIPTGRTIQGMGQLIVGVSLSLPDTGGSRAMQQTYMSTHGMTTANTTVLVDGMMVNGLQSDGAVQSYFNDAMNQEVSYQTSGIGADTQAGGVRLNMIPREGGNRFSGDFKSAYRPGTWQGDNLTQRHIDKGLKTGNATDRIIDFTVSQGGPILENRLWFFATGRYISVNAFLPDTFLDDGSKGVDDQFIKSGLARLTWQVSPRNKFSAYFDEVDKFRGHDMQALFDPETAATVWYSPAYHTTSAKWTSTVTNRLLVEGGFSNNTENYTNSYRPGLEQPRGTAAWFAGATRSELDLGGRTGAAPSQTTQSPIRFAVNASASYITGSHHLKVGFQRTWGTFFHTVDAHGDVTQQYRSNSTGKPFTVPDTVIVRNTPIAKYGERLNYDVGIYAQDSWTLKRLTINAGLRWEALNAQVEPATSPAGRFVPARTFAAIENLPNWRDPAPRFAVVYDLFGNAKTAIKYSINRYNQARTTGIAADYNPLVSLGATTATSPALAWRDVNGDDIAQGERGCNFGTNGLPGCEINFNNLAANFGAVALNTYGEFPRTWNLEHGLELQHELMPRLSMTGSWFHGDFYNLTTTINRSWQVEGDPLRNPNYVPMTVYNPITGEPITVYSRTAAAAAAPTLNLDTFDPDRLRIYNAFNLEFRARPGRGAQLFGGVSFERQLNVNCTSPDNPNSVRFCDDRENGVPFNKNFKMAASYPMPFGITLSGSFQSQVGNAIRNMTATTGGEVLSATRGTTRYPTNCPAPCPAGAVILPATFQPAALVVQLVPNNTVFTERVNQLDLKLSKTFRAGRVGISPTLEAFNVTNSDAVISYVSTNVLAASYLRPNSILQGRMIGVGANLRW
jgi:carboxypeptidase family protein